MSAKEKNKTWLLDPVHTKVRFESKYLLITSVSGWFTEIEGSVVAVANDFEDSQIQVTIYTKSLYTGNEEEIDIFAQPISSIQKVSDYNFYSSSSTVQAIR